MTHRAGNDQTPQVDQAVDFNFGYLLKSHEKLKMPLLVTIKKKKNKSKYLSQASIAYLKTKQNTQKNRRFLCCLY